MNIRRRLLWFTRYILQAISGFLIGLGIPLGNNYYSSISLLTVGITLFIISWYFRFIYRTQWEKYYNNNRVE